MNFDKIKIGILLLIMLLIFFVFISLNSKTINNSNIVIEIEKGDRVLEIAQKLIDAEIIRSKTFFLSNLFFSGHYSKLKAGEYEIISNQELSDLIELLTKGSLIPKSVTFIEGWSIVDIGKYLETENFARIDEIISYTGISTPQANHLGIESKPSYYFDFDILKDKPEDASLEGYLFPDTYRIENENIENLIKRMIQNLELKIAGDILKEINNSNKTIHEIIIMASLIEKEVFKLEDKKMVSDLLWRRMKIGMPLQIDATVNYITNKRGIDVTINETKIESEYNTYHILGLPKGPISNPGLESIIAAVYPQKNNYWYYLSDPKTGNTIFSRTHDEHVKAKNTYLR